MYSVYLVDDDILILDELKLTVPWTDNGFEVAGAQTQPQKALDDILRLSPDVVFCDLMMPGMDGNELIKQIRAHGMECEFVMVSAYDSFENVRSFFKQSGFDYILKPVKTDDIQIVLERLLVRMQEKSPDAEEMQTLNPNFNALLDFVDAHFNERITLELLAEQSGYSKNYICSLFSKHLGTSLSRHITDIRMKAAKELLQDKTVLLKEVAAQLGYKEYYHFYKVFREYYGHTPKEEQDGQFE